MGAITQTENEFLNSLVVDSIVYNLTIAQSLLYIETRFHAISERSYQQRKANVLSDHSTQLWLNHFTRVGFVQHHKQQMEVIQRLQDDSMRHLLVECSRNPRNEERILKMKADIRENSKLLSELGLGTPIISAIKAKLEQKENASTIQISQ